MFSHGSGGDDNQGSNNQTFVVWDVFLEPSIPMVVEEWPPRKTPEGLSDDELFIIKRNLGFFSPNGDKVVAEGVTNKLTKEFKQ